MAAAVTATITLTGGGHVDPFDVHRVWQHHEWTVELQYDGRTMELPYYTGELAGEPTAADVLGCVLLDASGVVRGQTFDEWAADYGYDTDSRRAEALYRRVVEQTDRLRELLGDEFDAATDGREDPESVARALTDDDEPCCASAAGGGDCECAELDV